MKSMKGLAFCLLSLLAGESIAQVNIPRYDTAGLNGNHDLHLPAWGPYSKGYAGISHIPELKSGKRFDFSVLPGYYRNKILVPNVRFESSYFPWNVKEDLSKIVYRYELEWKDQVYTDVTYQLIDPSTVLVSVHCVNNTALPQNLSLNLVGSVSYPENYGLFTLQHDNDAKWYNAVGYRSVSYAVKKPTDNLVTDGWMRGEVRDQGLIEGRGIGQGFGRQAGDKLEYEVNFPQDAVQGRLLLVYTMKSGKGSALQLSGLLNQRVDFKPSDTLAIAEIPFTAGKDRQRLAITSLGGGDIVLNGFALTTSKGPARIVPATISKSPVTEEDPKAHTLLLKYRDIPMYYGITWDQEPSRIRTIQNDELDIYMREVTHNHVSKVLKGNMKGEYANVFIRPVELQPFSSQTCTALISYGPKDSVLATLTKNTPLQTRFAAQLKDTISAAKGILPEGAPYLFTNKMLKSALFSNIVYPIYTQGQFIRHFTPGKWWNSLYTWDVGFIALGLTTADSLKLAIDCLNAYLTPPGSQSAFVHHGSPVPVQVYAFLEIWNKTQSKELLSYFYPGLKQYYEFMAGRYGSSTTNVLQSNLLKTWDYFYNSGGWDDYPPQVEVHKRQLEKSVTPVITTAQVIRMAKILRMAARALNKTADLEEYDKDIQRFSTALQRQAWDAGSGYFSYMLHDSSGRATTFFKDPRSGDNFNKGLDGAYPLVAGICTPAQQEGLIDKLFSPRHMWSPSGITVVDQSAPYYLADGYWNGAVWMPHQWFVWKTMLDLDRSDLASKVAMKGLDVFRRETDASYYTFEHFLASTGRGAGWHQFSGLSTPVLAWFAAYFKTGTITPGFEIWINEQAFNGEYTEYKAAISFDQATAPHKRAMLAGMNPAFDYQATFNGKPIAIARMAKGVLQLTLPATNKSGTLLIRKK
ncbi:putative membrane protein [Chitinophaga terrae (ex Kim and Jung 2007)]|uniref:MGH1-like glycoside hydrolase domain-containing protein n=1 Tax=Chitinophaga terrae (ex Kim and Jung 2007) TaxID=408074 RepID=UPI0027861425|nr:hypothetical protein [Chitinophaga terrae (ex Kim and Jung 2007)]MDQ0107407.1 putative membrane protein [Chitinophaga terrae (ex Kim and Jung 2007)]